MCRLAAYSGPPLLLRRLLLEPPHNLVRQAYAPVEMDQAVLNADGYGFGWYLPDAATAVYTSTLPIWSDRNLPGLAAALSCHLWLANVRSATQGQPLSDANTQPFANGHWLFLHNGLIEDFSRGLRAEFHRVLDPELQAGIAGNTDSEYLFALILQELAAHRGDPAAAIAGAIGVLDRMLNGRKALLALILCDGERLYATRHALNATPPTLYYCEHEAAYPEALLIASERLTAAPGWQAIPPKKLLIAADGRILEWRPL
jgi:glutamine amidotransferase